VVAQLGQLRASGIRVAIDDVGTDYSSLPYLEAMPLDTLKIDRSFVLKLDAGKGRSLVGVIVRMAEALGPQTVAEGVETAGQLAQVQALGCDYVQGYHYSAPVPACELEATVERIHDPERLDARRAA